MRQNIVTGILFMLLLISGCTKKQEGSIAGRVNPPAAGVRVTAMQNGVSAAAIDVNSQDGAFSVMLPSGTYDVNVSIASSPMPLVFPGIVVEPGKITALPPIDLTPPAGHGTLGGRIIPAGAGTKIFLVTDGRERAAVNADAEGRYRFTELPAGVYTVEASADGYARDAVTVNLAQEQTATQDMRLFYQSAVDGVDWAAGKIHVSGTGLPPIHAANATIQREMARRAALADAQRNLLKALDQLKISPDKSLKTFWGEKKYTEKIQGFIQGYKILSEQETIDGKIHIEIELPLTGPGGLSRSLAE